MPADAPLTSPKKRKKVKAPKPKPYVPPPSRSDAAQRTGATTPTRTARGPQGLPTQRSSSQRPTRLSPDGKVRRGGEKPLPVKAVRHVVRARKRAEAQKVRATARALDDFIGYEGPALDVEKIPSVLKKALDPYRKNTYLVNTGGGPSTLASITRKGGATATPAVVNLKGTEAGKLLRNVFNDAVDLPANVVTSGYLTGKQLVEEGPAATAKSLAKGTVDTLKNWEDHPLYAALTVSGGKAVVGRGAGAAMRKAPSKTTRRLASLERQSKIVPGTGREVRRQYSKDVITKAGQVAWDRRQAKKRVKRGEDPHPVASKEVMPGRVSDYDRLVDEDVQAETIITQENQSKVAREALDAVAPRKGRGPRRRKKPSAAASLAAQGIVSPSRADLAAYLSEIKARASKLKTPEERKANLVTQKLIEKALKDFKPDEVKRAAEAYSALRRRQEQEVVDLGLVDPLKAEATRVDPARARRAKVKAGKKVKAAKKERRAAGAARTQAQREADEADVAYAKAKNDAKAARIPGRGVPPREADALLRAIDRRDRAHAALDRAKQDYTRAEIKLGRANLPRDAVEPAYVSHQSIEPRAAALPVKPVKVPIKSERKGPAVQGGTLDAHPGKLVDQAIGTQRLIDATKARRRFLDGWAFRRDGEPPAIFDSAGSAKGFARKQGMERDWVAMRRDDDKYVLVPKVAKKRLEEHADLIGQGHTLSRAIGSQWRRNVLAFSPRWLTGNVVEAAVRSVVARSGPLSYATAKRAQWELGGRKDLAIRGKVIVKGKKGIDPDAARQLSARTTGGGNYTQAHRLARDKLVTREASDLGRMSEALYKLRQTPGPRHLADAYGAYTDFVFRALNGRIENQFQTAMLGKALRDHPLMSNHVRKLSKKAVEEAAEGLRNTNTMVELGRAVDDMYGRYTKFSPGLRSAITNYTPFLAWTRNALRFLYVVMPRDHPVLAAAAASMSAATEEARKAIGSYYDITGATEGQLPPYLQGSIPGEGGSHLRVSRYGPMGLFNAGVESTSPLEGFEGLLLPQFSEIIANVARGEDWKGESLSEENPNAIRNFIAGVTTFLEGQVPAAHLAVDISGVQLPNMPDEDRAEGTVASRARKTLDPFMYTPPSPSRRPKVKAPSDEFDFGDSASDEFDFSGGTDDEFDFGG